MTHPGPKRGPDSQLAARRLASFPSVLSALLLLGGVGWLLLAAADGEAQDRGAASGAALMGEKWQHADRLDDIFRALDGADAPGCAAGVVEGGALVHARGFGSGNLDHGIPLDARSVFYLASVSKQFTAAAVRLAAEQGHLSLDDEVRRWIPELPDYGASLTVRHLVHHTSGLRDYLTLMSLAGLPYGDAFDDAAMLGLITRQRALNFAPGSESLYSNTGYVLLAELIRRATGRSLREFSEAEIFRPLGMNDTHFHDDATRIVPRRVTSYARSDDADFRVSYLAHFDRVGDGGLYSTIEDLSLWMSALMDDRLGPPGFGVRLLERGVLSSGETLDYAFGQGIGDFRGVKEVSHGGSMMGFRTSLRLFPEERAGTVVLCNLDDVNPSTFSAQMAEIVLHDRLAASAPAREAGGAPAGSSGQDGSVALLPELGADERAAFTGVFISDELQVEYRVESVEDRLMLLFPGVPAIPLQFMGGDVYSGPRGLTLRFGRDAADVVDGFRLDAGRVRGIEFVRPR